MDKLDTYRNILVYCLSGGELAGSVQPDSDLIPLLFQDASPGNRSR